MSTLKTQPTQANASEYLEHIDHPVRRQDGLFLLEFFERLTDKPPVMWGERIVGYGAYHYTRRDNKQYSWPMTGFSVSKQRLTLYIMLGFEPYPVLMARLGKYKLGKSCLYINKLADVDLEVLEELVRLSLADLQQKYRCD